MSDNGTNQLPETQLKRCNRPILFTASSEADPSGQAGRTTSRQNGCDSPDFGYEPRTTAGDCPFVSGGSPSELTPRVVVVGCSGHARVVLDAIEEAGSFRIAGILDTFKLPG